MTSFTHYILDGTKVVAQYQTTTSSITPSNVIYFYYDESGSPTGMKYNGNVYFFQKNLQGDIIRILNTQGSIVATYTYDAWGNIIASTDTSGVSIGTKNPFRYRGYYYDTETGLYYLNSRYYDPQVGRFLNADGFVSTGQGLLGSNMFAYCLNNPVVFSDHMGCAARHSLQQSVFGDGIELPQKKSFWNKIGDWCRDAYNTVVDTCNAVIDFVTNEDEATTYDNLKKYGVAFYNGTFVFVASLPGDGGAFSYGVICIDDFYFNSENGKNFFSDTLKHEYGHKVHLEQIGIVAYTFKVAIPSLIFAGLSDHSNWVRKNYFNLPWERIADKLGGVDRGYSSLANTFGSLYWIDTVITGALTNCVLDY